MVRRHSRKAESGREALPEVKEWSKSTPGRIGGPPKRSGVVGRHFWKDGRPVRWSESGWEALTEGREWSGVPPRGSAVV